MVINHLLSGEISFGLVKVSSLQDLLSSEILTLLGKTVGLSEHFNCEHAVYNDLDDTYSVINVFVYKSEGKLCWCKMTFSVPLVASDM